MKPEIVVTLSAFRCRRLERLRRTARDRDLRLRIDIVLFSAEGQAARAAARRLGIAPSTVRRWRLRWNAFGEMGLRSAPRYGRPPKATPPYRRLLFRCVRTPPESGAAGDGVWTAKRLSAHLESLTGIRLSPERVRQLLRGRLASRRRSRAGGATERSRVGRY